MSDKITLCVATYRGAARVDRILSSAASFSGPILVSDDGSNAVSVTDAEQICEVVDRHKNSRLLVASENRGAFANLNRLLRACETPYALLLDDDGIYPAGLAERAVHLLDRVSHVGMLSWVSRDITSEEAESYRGGYVPDGEGRGDLPDFDTELAAFCSAYRVATIRNIGFFDEGYRYYYGDSDAAIRLTSQVNPCFRIQWPRVPHVEHSTIHKYAELNGDRGKLDDYQRFLGKWHSAPSEARDRIVKTLDCRQEIVELSRP